LTHKSGSFLGKKISPEKGALLQPDTNLYLQLTETEPLPGISSPVVQPPKLGKRKRSEVETSDDFALARDSI